MAANVSTSPILAKWEDYQVVTIFVAKIQNFINFEQETALEACFGKFID